MIELFEGEVERIVKWGETRKDEYDYQGSKGWDITDENILKKLKILTSHRRDT